MKCLIACDSFKGSLTSKEAGMAIQSALKKLDIDSDYLLISDGGEGYTQALAFGTAFEKHWAMSCDSLFRPRRGLYLKDGDTLYFNLADVVGISFLRENEINAYTASTYGLGALIKKAVIKHRPRNVILSVGGSSTNDMGLGMLEGMGARFFAGDDLLEGLTLNDFDKITRIDLAPVYALIGGISFTVLTDVNNPLLGENGATYVYGMQKGIRQDDLARVDGLLERVESMIAEITHDDRADNAGCGAAGGVGFIAQSVFGADIASGIDRLLDAIGFAERAKRYDCVITGEGCFDAQSLNGKVVSGILNSGIENTVIVSAVKKSDMPNAYSIVPDITTKENSLKYPKKYLKRLIYKIFGNEAGKFGAR